MRDELQCTCVVVPLNRTKLLGSILAIGLPLLLVGTSAWAQNSAFLTGGVSDTVSAPLAKVSVKLSSLDRVLQEETGADGGFRFDNVPPGTYELEFSAEGFVKQKLPITLSSGDSRSLNIALPVGNTPDMNHCGPHPSIKYEYPQSKGRRVAGIVRDYYDSRPVPKAEIALLRMGEKQPILTSSSDQVGKFELNAPPAGRYTLRVTRSG
jgi:hypothetical protein